MCMIFIFVVLVAMAALLPIIESTVVIEELKEFVDTLRTHLDNICADIQKITGERYCKEIQIYDVKVSIKSVADSAVLFVDSVDNLFYYCMETDFSEIKKNAAENNMVPLQKFVALMDEYLKQIGTKYESFRSDCKTAKRECCAAAERCYKLRAEANTKKNASRVIGGTVTSATIVGGTVASIVAGVFTLGIGTAVGLPLTAAASVTAGTVTHFVAKDYAKAENVFRRFSTKFNSLSLALEIKDKAASVHREIERYENSYRPLQYMHDHIYSSLCTTLDRLYSLSSTNRQATAECLNEIKSCKESVNKI